MGHRKLLASGISVSLFGGSFVLLSKAWYKDFPRSSFHAFNDSGEWLQMDKLGHAWTAYTISSASAAMWRWAGMNEKKATLLASGTSLLYQLSIEYLDGRSAEWGWSWSDVSADISGTLLFAMQQLTWKEQRVQLKFSTHRNSYEPVSLEPRANVIFGKTLPGRLLKDYNAQTYWLSYHVRRPGHHSGWPSWLNIALGYGAQGMFGGYQNLAQDKNGNVIFDRRDIKRYRQWYLAPDIDLTQIRTKSKFIKTGLAILNCLKFPAPAVELSNGSLKLRALVF